MDMVEVPAGTKTNCNASNKGTSNGSDKEINKLLSAAVVSARFRHLLLTDPRAALKAGYNGESFDLDERTRARILAITASSLSEFAARLTTQT
jgi:hypothetical protein